MPKIFNFKLLPSEASNDAIIKTYIAQASGEDPSKVSGFTIVKKSIDARSRQPWINISLEAFVNEPWQERKPVDFHWQDVRTANRKVIIIGAGPAGLFAALRLLEAGIKPVIIERGKDVRARRKDLAILNKQGVLNPESNYCFGEGGAGTFSDGKLYTRSSKRGDINRILQVFYHFGATENILYDSHPHIGTNKLPAIITAIRDKILDAGGEVLFEKKLIDLITSGDRISGVRTADGDLIEGDAVILATGHSARDVFHLLEKKKIAIESKPFALGLRVEHPQELINQVQYHCRKEDCDPALPPASYSLVQQVQGIGVFSFCMCPGGIIAPASTDQSELVVNGWSPSKRNNPFANSGIVAQILQDQLQNLPAFEEITSRPAKILETNLGMMYFQQYVERMAFNAGGGKFVAPAQRLADFCDGRASSTLPACSYLPGLSTSNLSSVLPAFVYKKIQQAMKEFGKRMNGYLTNEAVAVATESRTSSPVRIPRDAVSLAHPQIKNLYPCGEGAGYAGGIVSAAMDGEKIAAMTSATLVAREPK